MQEKDTVLEVKNLYKLFGPYDFLDERKAAFKLLELGASRMDVMETTGIMAAISDVSFSVKRGAHNIEKSSSFQLAPKFKPNVLE